MSKAIAYLRTSSAAGIGDDKDSQPRQRLAIEAYARANNIEIVDEFADEAVKGSDHITDRPGFAAMLERIAGNGVKCVLVETANRFARDLIVQETGWRFLQAQGIDLIAVDSPSAFLDDTPTAVLIRQILGAVAQFEKASLVAKLAASRCKAIHGWYDLSSVYHIAYVCEQNVYVDTGGTLTEITPSGGWPAPPLPSQGGYGDLAYGAENYGTPRSSSTILAVDQMPNVWSVDNFGAILVVMYSADGRLLQWDPAAGGLLTRVANSPMGRCMVVTQERFCMIFGQTADGTTGGGSFRRFGWCDQENLTAWDFSNVVSQAGFLDIEPASPIVTAISGRFGTVFFTAKKAYVNRYLGLPYVYNYVELADECTPWSPASITTTSSYILWQSEQGTFSFDGTTIMPVACLVRPWVTDDVDPANVREQACAIHISDFNEFWWFFPQAGQPWNTRCIIYNYIAGWWSQGTMSRSAGVTSSYTVQPILADGTVAFQHELGRVYAHADNPWAETFDLNLTSGVRLATLKQVIPDIKACATSSNPIFDPTTLQFSFFFKNQRTGSVKGQWTAPVAVRTDGYVDARVTGRDIRLRISVPGPQVLPFTLGQHLVDFAVRGDR